MTAPTNETTGAVYALIDPRDNRVRYIGATTKPLKARLQGHLASPVAIVKAWVDALAAEGLKPRIAAITEGVPESQLRDLERDEITRRLVSGERLLNQSATAQGRRQVERLREQQREERERAAWAHAANQVRLIVGGPLAPRVTPIPLSAQARADYRSLMRATEEAEHECAPNSLEWGVKTGNIYDSRVKAADDLWRSVQPVWGRLRSVVYSEFEDVLAGRVGSVFKEPWADIEDASRYLALLPWGIIAVGPWAALATRAGMDVSGTEFIRWVSDDPAVREALDVLLVRSGGRMGPLWALENLNNLSGPSTLLVAMTAAHYPEFDLPRVLHRHVGASLRSALDGKQLTRAMSDLLCKLDPRALDVVLGPNIAADIDDQLGLPPGTSKSVLDAVIDRSDTAYMDRLHRIVSRANEAFPSVETPNFASYVGNSVPALQAISVSLVVSGLLPAPSGKSQEEAVDAVRALWCGDLSRLSQVA